MTAQQTARAIIEAGDVEAVAEWTLWSVQRPTDTTAKYRWRIPERKILGMMLRPEWTDTLHCCGMGYGQNEWWPRCSNWDGYVRSVPEGLEWRVAAADEIGVAWCGLDMLPSPFTGLPPKIEYHGRWIGAPPYAPEYLTIVSYLVGFNSWTDASRMQAAWNTRATLPAAKEG